MDKEELHDLMRFVKKQFLTFRNGIVSDTLRRAGMTCYDVIFGLNLPQLSAIAAELPCSVELAEALWADRKVRESRLLATYIFPKEDVDKAKACELMSDVQTREEADILCFRLLRHLPIAPELAEMPPVDSPHGEYLRKALQRSIY